MTLPAVQAFSPDQTLAAVVFRGSKFSSNVAAAVTSATISLSMTEVSELAITISDPDFKLLASGIFNVGATVTYQDLKMEVTGQETSPGGSGLGNVTVRSRSFFVQQLKRRRGPRVLRNVSPTDFVRSECSAVGLRLVGQLTGRRSQVSRDVVKAGEKYGTDIPSSWTTFQRLARESGFYMFEAAGLLYFGKPTWLLKNVGNYNAPVKVTWRVDQEFFHTITPPSCRRSTDSTDGISADFEVPLARAPEFRPGRSLVLAGVPSFEGRYIVSATDFSLAGIGTCSVSAVTPIDPTPEPPDPPATPKVVTKTTKSTASKTPAKGPTTSAFDFVAVALSQAGKRYVFGAEASTSNPNPSAFDCSELVQWACGRVGVFMVDGSANQKAYCTSKHMMIPVSTAIRTRGALLFHPGHVAISLGDGRTIEAMNESAGVRVGSAAGRFTSAAKVPGMRY